MNVLILPLLASGCFGPTLLLFLLFLLLIYRALHKDVLGWTMNRAVNGDVIRFTMVSGQSFSLLNWEDISVPIFMLRVLVLLPIVCSLGGLRLSMHSWSGIGYLSGCLNDLVEFGHCLWVLSGQLLHGPFILATLLEGHNHPVFNHVGGCVVDIAEPSDKIPKSLIRLLDTCEQIILVIAKGVCCMKIGLKHLA